MEITGKLYDLRKTDKKDEVWKILSKMTVRGWRAGPTFRNLKNGFYTEGEYLLYLLSCDGVPAAWGMSVNYGFPYGISQLWLYTKPKFRKQGLQKNYVIPFWNEKTEKGYFVHERYRRQIKTFKYVKKIYGSR